jgi:hypothetical protein
MHCGRLFEEGLTEIASSRFDQGVQLREEGDGPEEVAADEGEDKGRSPQAGNGQYP